MAIYYHNTPKAFYDEEFHGFRKMSVPDPAWVRPNINVTLAPGESITVRGQLVENNGEDSITIYEVPDESAIHPLISVDNVDCKIPINAKLITVARHQELLDGESSGKIISEDEDGRPILIDPPPPSSEQLASQERIWRDGELASTDQMVARHRDEVEDGSSTTLTAEQYSELQAYRRDLRNWPDAGEFPLVEHRPVAPYWLIKPIQ